MRSLWIASLFNIVLCPLLISCWGLKGAAIATVIGRSSGVAYQCYHLFKGSGILKIKLSYFTFQKELFKNLFEVAYPATVQFIIQSGSWIVMSKLVAEIGGTNASAGYQIAIRNLIFFILPAWGLSNAAATLVGQNLGAKKPERAEASVWLSTKYNTFFMSFVAFLFIFFSEPIICFFTQQEEVIVHGVQSLQIIGSGFIFYGISMVLMQALNGAGDTRTPTRISFFCFWICQVPLAYFLAKFLGWNTYGVYMAVPISETLLAVVAWYYFRLGKWKTVEV
jgi:putative MATE family efflux protein